MKKQKKIKSFSKKYKLALIFSFIVCLLFFTSFVMSVPIERSNCEAITTSFEYCKTIKGRYADKKGLHIYCANSKSYYVDEAYLGFGLKENIEIIDKGTTLTLLVDNNSEIVELSIEDEVLFSYSDYVERVEKEKKNNLLFFLLSLSLPIIAVVNIFREKNRFGKVRS